MWSNYNWPYNTETETFRRISKYPNWPYEDDQTKDVYVNVNLFRKSQIRMRNFFFRAKFTLDRQLSNFATFCVHFQRPCMKLKMRYHRICYWAFGARLELYSTFNILVLVLVLVSDNLRRITSFSPNLTFWMMSSLPSTSLGSSLS